MCTTWKLKKYNIHIHILKILFMFRALTQDQSKTIENHKDLLFITSYLFLVIKHIFSKKWLFLYLDKENDK